MSAIHVSNQCRILKCSLRITQNTGNMILAHIRTVNSVDNYVTLFMAYLNMNNVIDYHHYYVIWMLIVSTFR